MTSTVRRTDITVEEEVKYDSLYAAAPVYLWRAELDGELSTGETARMNRQGQSAAEALENLERAISEQGWVIK